jgi:REP element-mobilizing transposase RayT
MARVARLDSPGVLQHVIVRGIERRKIFLDDKDRSRFLERLSKLLEDTETLCYAWALMPNHIHLLLLPTRFKLAVLMRRLLTGYAVTFNLVHHRSGHLFQNRYKSIVCDKDSYLLELIRYIHLNPLRTGLVDTLEKLDRYRWTGHAVLMGYSEFKGQVLTQVLSHFGPRVGRSRERYRQFVADGAGTGYRVDLTGKDKRGRRAAEGAEGGPESDPRILGDKEFTERMLRDRPMREKACLITPSQLIEKTSLALGLEAGAVREPSKTRLLAEARGMICYVGIRELGYSGLEMGKELNLGAAGVSRALRRGELLFREAPEVKKRIVEEIVK